MTQHDTTKLILSKKVSSKPYKKDDLVQILCNQKGSSVDVGCF